MQDLNLFRDTWMIGSGAIFQKEKISSPATDSEGNKDGHYLLALQPHNKFSSPIGSSEKTCLSFDLAGYGRISITSRPSLGSLGVPHEIFPTQSSNWTAGQIRVGGFEVVFEVFTDSIETWVAIDNIAFSYAIEGCEKKGT